MVDIDVAGEFSDLAFERDGAAAVPFADFDAEQFAVPPGGFGRVRMRAAAGDGDQAAAAEQQQVAIGDSEAGVGKCRPGRSLLCG